jgi:hypothetical protein
MSHRHVALVALLLPAAASCLPDPEEEVAIAVVQSALQSADQQSAARQVADAAPDDCSLTAEQLAIESAESPVVGVYPPSCLTKDAEGARVHAEYDHCNTIFGTSDISGGIDATIEATGACTLRADLIDSGDFTDHEKPYSYEATVDITVRPGERDLQWRDHWQGTTEKDQAIEQRGNWHVLYHRGTGCYDFDGPAEGTLDGTPYDYEIAELSICEGECPSQGTGVVQWDDTYEMTVKFDGSAVAKVTGRSGREFEVDMICRPAAAR